MKFRSILFTLLICTICFAGIQEEIPDLEKSSLVVSNNASIDAVIETTNLPAVNLFFESAHFGSDCVVIVDVQFVKSKTMFLDQTIQPIRHRQFTSFQESNFKNFNSYQSHRKPRDGLSFFS